MQAYALELRAVQYGLAHFGSCIAGSAVVVRCDNSTAVHYVNRMSSQGSLLCYGIAKEIRSWCKANRCWIHATFIPGKVNIEADFMSRIYLLTLTAN